MNIKNCQICWECQARTLNIESAKAMFEQFYLTDKLSTYKIADRFDCSWYTIAKWLKYYNIPLRKQGGAMNKGNKLNRNKYL
jgi:hypothetical protein